MVGPFLLSSNARSQFALPPSVTLPAGISRARAGREWSWLLSRLAGAGEGRPGQAIEVCPLLDGNLKHMELHGVRNGKTTSQ